MFQLPFDEWTLHFYNKEHELKYQQEQEKYRLLCLKLFNLTLFLVCLVSLFVFVAQSQSQTIIFIQSGLVILNFANTLTSKLYTKCFRIVFACNFIISIVAAAYISRGMHVPLFVYGHSVGTMLMFLLQNMENKVKLIFICTSPFVIFGIYDTYHISALAFISFSLICSLLSGVQLFHNEYNQRLLFSLKLITQRQKDMIYELIEDSIILVSWNERSRQFELQFQNRQFETEFNIENTQNMKEFFRYVKINNPTTAQRFQEQNQNLSLEQCLFQIINSEEGNVIKQNHNKFDVQIDKKNEKIQRQILVRKLHFGKQLLLVQILKEDKVQQNDEYENKLQQIRETVTEEIQTSIRILKQLMQEMNSFRIMRSYMQSMLSSILTVVFQMKNLVLHLQKEKLELLRNDMKMLSLIDLVDSIYPYFVCTAQKLNRSFQLQNQVNRNLIVQLNTKFLIQILINIFSLSLKQAFDKSSIILTISQEIDFNPSFDNQKFSNQCSSQTLLTQYQIKFSFNFKKYISNKISLSPLEEGVTNRLLQILGPYNYIFSISEPSMAFSQLHETSIYFYVYADQSQLDQPFTKNICQQKI